MWGWQANLFINDREMYNELFGADGTKKLSWTSQNLLNAVDTWNKKLIEIWDLMTKSPQDFKEGKVWELVQGINSVLVGIALGLLVLFFLIGVVKTCGSFAEVKKPEHVFKLFIRGGLTYCLILYGMELLEGMFEFTQGLIKVILAGLGATGITPIEVPAEAIQAIEGVNAWKVWEQLPLWLVCTLGSIGAMIMAYLVLMTVYVRFIKLYMHVALAPIPLSGFAGEPTQNMGRSFIKSFCSVCLEIVVMLLACLIYSKIASIAPMIDPGASNVAKAWAYIGEIVFNMFVLLGTMKMGDRVVKEMMGL